MLVGISILEQEDLTTSRQVRTRKYKKSVKSKGTVIGLSILVMRSKRNWGVSSGNRRWTTQGSAQMLEQQMRLLRKWYESSLVPHKQIIIPINLFRNLFFKLEKQESADMNLIWGWMTVIRVAAITLDPKSDLENTMQE